MILVADSSGIMAAADADDEHHEKAKKLLMAEESVISQIVMTEVDHIMSGRHGWRIGMQVTDFVTYLIMRRGHRLARIDPTDLPRIQQVRRQYAGLKLDLADAAAVVLADKYKTRRILTLDQRDFRALHPLTPGFESFKILPADE